MMDRQTDREADGQEHRTNATVAFRNFGNAPNGSQLMTISSYFWEPTFSETRLHDLRVDSWLLGCAQTRHSSCTIRLHTEMPEEKYVDVTCIL